MLACSITAVIFPLIIGAFVALLIAKQEHSEVVSAWISGIALGVSLLCLFAIGPVKPYEFEKAFVITDGLTMVVSSLILLLTLLIVVLSSGTLIRQGIDMVAEYYALLLFAAAGAIVFISAGHFLSLFMGLEILSLALYVLCASSILRPRSSEGAIKYFILGATSSAIFMFGVALIFGVTGTLSFSEVRNSLETINSQATLIGVALVIIGVAFKLALVPFHSWSPDAYLGAPLSVSSFMATVVKLSAIVVAIRVIWFSFEHVVAFWSTAIAAMAGASIVLGNLLALQQTRLRRLMAYSGISHAGFMVIGLLASLDESSSVGAVLFYALTYPLVTLGFFAVLHTILKEENITDDSFSILKGLFSKSPFMAVAAVLFLFGLAGLPPVMVGFLSKWYVLQVAWTAEYAWLVYVGIGFSLIGTVYYLKPISYIFSKDVSVPKEEAPTIISQQRIVVSILFLITMWISIFPGSLSYYCDQLLRQVSLKEVREVPVANE